MKVKKRRLPRKLTLTRTVAAPATNEVYVLELGKIWKRVECISNFCIRLWNNFCGFPLPRRSFDSQVCLDVSTALCRSSYDHVSLASLGNAFWSILDRYSPSPWRTRTSVLAQAQQPIARHHCHPYLDKLSCWKYCVQYDLSANAESGLTLLCPAR